MIIKRMRATFGRLAGEELALEDGLNVLTAPNEAGKSTWCAFLRAMLYGIPTGERDRKGYLAEKNRYQPWSGAPMEGEIELVWRGQGITLRRTGRAGAPMSQFEAVYTGTAEPVPGLTGDNCGQTLLGVDRKVWERSAFLGQAPTLAIDGTPELERRIQAIFSSGQEDVSYSQTQDTLKKWRNARRHNQTGYIPRLEGEIAGLDQTLAELRDAARREAEARAERLELERREAELEREKTAREAWERRELENRYEQAGREEQELRDRLNGLERERERDFRYLPARAALKEARDKAALLRGRRDEAAEADRIAGEAEAKAARAEAEARDERFDGLDGAAAERGAREDADRCRLLEGRARGMRRRAALWAGLCLAGAAALGGLYLAGRLALPLAAGGAGACVLLALALLLGLRAGAGACLRERQEILRACRVSDPEGIEEAARAYRAARQEADYARQRAGERREEQERRMAALRDGEAELTRFAAAFAPGVTDAASASEAVERALHVADALDEARDKLSGAVRRCEDLRAQGAGRERPGDLPDGPAPLRGREEIETELARTRAEIAACDRRRALAEGELASRDDPARLEARRARASEELERRRLEYDALTLALETLDGANAQMQQRFAPELNRRAGEILSRLTGGRYTTVTLDRQFEASAAGDGRMPHSALELSRGASEQLYLAVRLAVCELCLPTEDPSPLVLDDALVTFDDARMRLALTYLAGLGRQILLFSCQEREGGQGLGAVRRLQS